MTEDSFIHNNLLCAPVKLFDQTKEQIWWIDKYGYIHGYGENCIFLGLIDLLFAYYLLTITCQFCPPKAFYIL